MYQHDDVLAALNRNLSLADKLRFLHGVLKERYAFVDRIAVAVYEPKTDLLKTFLSSSATADPLPHYQARLSDAPALKAILDHGRPRVVEDLALFSASEQEHTRRILAGGFRSSYTMPMYLDGTFFGFVFFNSHAPGPFTPEALHYLDLFGHLISLVFIAEISAIQTLLAAIKTARDVAHHRDIETGAHLDRMAGYARLIARGLAGKYRFTDDYIEHIFLFAPLHDIGKIAVPDRILLKPGKLTAEEYEQMKQHVEKGRQIIDEMLGNFGLSGIQHVDILRNIAGSHHEALDGSGYPQGLRGGEIPIEARIVAVADVFDALTSRRPYKKAWPNDEAFAALHRLAGVTLDRECVETLERHRSDVEAIQARFLEDRFG